jgi:hypothetical protein
LAGLYRGGARDLAPRSSASKSCSKGAPAANIATGSASFFRIDDFQQTYVVIAGFEELFAATRPDLAPVYRRLPGSPELEPAALLPADRVLVSAGKRAEPVCERRERKKMGRG